MGVYVEGIDTDSTISWYNLDALEGKKVNAHSYVVAVNRVRGGDIKRALQTDGDLEIVVRKPLSSVPISVALHGKPVGLELIGPTRPYLFVKAVRNGAVTDHNRRANTKQQINVPCRIVSVDGCSGESSVLIAKIKQ